MVPDREKKITEIATALFDAYETNDPIEREQLKKKFETALKELFDDTLRQIIEEENK